MDVFWLFVIAAVGGIIWWGRREQQRINSGEYIKDLKRPDESIDAWLWRRRERK